MHQQGRTGTARASPRGPSPDLAGVDHTLADHSALTEAQKARKVLSGNEDVCPILCILIHGRA